MKVISSLGGRIGNIFFRALTGKYLADKLGCSFTAVWEGNGMVYENGETEQDYYRAIAPYFSNIHIETEPVLWNQVKHLAAKEQGAATYTPIPTDQDPIAIGGCRHSPRYWNDDKAYALEIFRSDWDTEIYRFIEQAYPDVNLPDLVSVNVRRGDFCRLGISVPGNWYLKCIGSFEPSARFLIVSDDIPWCKTVFRGERFIFADRPTGTFSHQKYLIDFYLQRLCKHNIISNSTFSWWAAYLNETEGRKVYYPWPWNTWATGDFIPKNDNWIAIWQ